MSRWLTGVILNVREAGKYEYNKIFVIEPRSYDQLVNDTQSVFNTSRSVHYFVGENNVTISDDLDLAFLNDGAFLVVHYCFEWSISNEKISEYKDEYTSTIDGRNAQSIFSRYSLDNKDLAKIWDLSDRNKDGILDEYEYVLARFLIDARLQNEQLPDVVPDSLLYSVFTPFQLSRSSDGNNDFSRFFYSQDLTSGRLPEELKKNKRNSANSQPRINESRKGLTKTKTSETKSIPKIQVIDDDSLWTISKKERKKYSKLFLKHSKHEFVSGEDAFELFTQSGLGRNTLAKIWSLSDNTKTGNLNKVEFYVALHVIHLVSQNLAKVPDEIPSILWESAEIHKKKGHRRQISLDTPPISGKKFNALSTGMLSSFIKSFDNDSDPTHSYLTELEITGVKKYPSEIISREEVIGKGSFSKVWKGVLNAKKVALKEIHITSNEDLDGWIKEITLMHALTSYNYLVNLIGFSTKDLTLTIIMELCEQGSLYDLIHSQRVQWSMLQKLRTLRHVVKGIQSLHKSNIIHRDLKSLNILVTDKGIAKLSDLGCSTRLDRKDRLTVGVGSPLWMAPEVKSSSAYSFPSDIFSFGVVAYEVQNEKLPVLDKETRIVTIPSTAIGYQLISLCINDNPDERPTAKELIEIYTQAVHKYTKTAARKVSKTTSKETHPSLSDTHGWYNILLQYDKETFDNLFSGND